MKLSHIVPLLLLICCISSVLNAHIKRRNRKFHQTQEEAYRIKEKEVLKNLFDRLKYDKYLSILKALASDEQAYNEIKSMMKEELLNAKVYLVRIPVNKLRPTQSEIGLSDSLQYPFEHPPKPETTKYQPFFGPHLPLDMKRERHVYSKDKRNPNIPKVSELNNVEESDLFSNKTIVIKEPIVTYNGQYVIDGHHRWSELYMINPYANIAALNIEVHNGDNPSPLSMLKIIQRFILKKSKESRSEKAGFINVFTANEYVLKQFIRTTMTQGFVDYYMQKTNIKSFEGVVESIYKNIRQFQMDKKPIEDAPMRMLMPQTDVKLNKLLVSAGNYAPLYKLPNEVNQNDGQLLLDAADEDNGAPVPAAH